MNGISVILSYKSTIKFWTPQNFMESLIFCSVCKVQKKCKISSSLRNWNWLIVVSSSSSSGYSRWSSVCGTITNIKSWCKVKGKGKEEIKCTVGGHIEANGNLGDFCL